MNTISVLDQKLAIPEGHFRSKFYVSANSLNNYIAAAGPIFSILERLNTASQIDSFETIHDTISHEIKAFLSQIYNNNQYQEQDTIAYFLICATTDEILGKILLKFQINNPKSFKAFTQNSNNNFEPAKKFFEIIEFLKIYPENNLNLLEFAYYCLTLGYEGIYHSDINGRQLLDNHIEDLYQLIRSNRLYEPSNLFREYQPQVFNNKQKYKFFLKITGVFVIIATVVYLCDYFILASSVNAIKTEHQYTLALED